MQHSFKVGDKIKVVKFKNFTCKEYKSFLGQVFTVKGVFSGGVTTISPNTSFSGLFFYNEEIELVGDTPVREKQEVAVKQQKNHAWAVVNKSTGKVEWIRMTRRSARSMVAILKDTENSYKVKKIQYNFA